MSRLILTNSENVPKGTRREAIQSELSRLLREERQAKGLSMTSVAEKAGLSQQMVSYVERGMRQPTLDTLLRICEAMDLELPKLLDDANRATKGKHQRS